MLFWRQKVLVALVQEAPLLKASSAQLADWAFLLKHQNRIDEHGRFYDFVPYDHGPFSFLMEHEIMRLVDEGVLTVCDGFLCAQSSRAGGIAEELPSTQRTLVSLLAEEYGRLSEEELLNIVHCCYPWYASRSTAINCVSKACAEAEAVYTIGYEGLSIDAFLDALLRRGIEVVLDVRAVPHSRKHGFSRPELEQKCANMAIEYCHLPEAGIPSVVRREADSEGDLWRHYSSAILPTIPDTISRITTTCSQRPTALLCFEADPIYCHRHVLAQTISTAAGFDIFNYVVEGSRWERQNVC